MNLPDSSWLKDRRVIVFGIGCALVGFLLALLIFGSPWHLPPNWGDVPTWLAVLAASVGGWIALSQLRQQQAVIEEDIARSRKRDDLLDRQLRELADRERSRQREQAEQVNLTPWPIRIPKPIEGPKTEAGTIAEQASPQQEKDKKAGSCRITNTSGRPVRRVACRLILDGRTILAGSFGVAATFSGHGGIRDHQMYLPPEDGAVDLAAGMYLHLLAQREIMAFFTIPDEIDGYQTGMYVIRFTDDAGKRWELDGNMHLAPAPNDDW